MLRLLSVEWLKLRRSPLILIGSFGVVLSPGLNALVALKRMYTEVGGPLCAWESHLNQAILFWALIGGTLIVGFAAVHIFVREMADDTLKNTLIAPHPRWMIYLAKVTILLAWTLGISAVGYLATLAVGFTFNSSAVAAGLLASHGFRWLLSGLGLFAVASIAIAVTLLARSYPIPIGYLVVATLSSLFTGFSWVHGYLIPWAAPTLAFYAEFQLEPIYTLVAVFVIFTIFNLAYFIRMDVD